jgi:hypothetical protein
MYVRCFSAVQYVERLHMAWATLLWLSGPLLVRDSQKCFEQPGSLRPIFLLHAIDTMSLNVGPIRPALFPVTSSSMNSCDANVKCVPMGSIAACPAGLVQFVTVAGPLASSSPSSPPPMSSFGPPAVSSSTFNRFHLPFCRVTTAHRGVAWQHTSMAAVQLSMASGRDWKVLYGVRSMSGVFRTHEHGLHASTVAQKQYMYGSNVQPITLLLITQCSYISTHIYSLHRMLDFPCLALVHLRRRRLPRPRPTHAKFDKLSSSARAPVGLSLGNHVWAGGPFVSAAGQ